MPTEQQVRTEVADLNRRIAAEIRTPTGSPPLTAALLDVDDIVDVWRAERERRRAERAALLADSITAPAPHRESRRRRWFRRP